MPWNTALTFWYLSDIDSGYNYLALRVDGVEQLRLTGNYTLEPAGNPTNDIDVNLITNPLGVTFSGFNHTFTSGLCDAPIIGDIIQAFLPDIESATTDGIRGFLSDPDGAGPGDSPIAAAIQSTLAGISISGPVGEGLGLMFESPLFQVVEDNTGITLGSNSRFQVSIGRSSASTLIMYMRWMYSNDP
jgi:hypothetical protein